MIGMVAGHLSEYWPAIYRNDGRIKIGIRSFAPFQPFAAANRMGSGGWGTGILDLCRH
jgi:hypothetical protein